MPVRTQNVSQHVLSKRIPGQRGHNMLLKQVLTKHIPSQRGHKMYRNMCLLNLSHDREDSICNATCVDQNPSQASEQLNICWRIIPHASDDWKCTSTCDEQTLPKPTRTQNLSQLLLTKPLPYQQGHKMHLSMCWQNPPNVNMSLYASQLVLTNQSHACN